MAGRQEGKSSVLRPGSLKIKDLQYVGSASVGEKLKVVKLLSQISDDDRARLGGLVEGLVFKPGQEVIKEGTVSSGLYMIQSGCAKVSKRDPHTRVRSVRCLLGVGDHFGEAAQLENPARGSSVHADGISDLKLWYLKTERLADLAVLISEDGHMRRRAISSEAPFKSPTPTRLNSTHATPIKREGKGSIAAMFASPVTPSGTHSTSAHNPATRQLLQRALDSSSLFAGLRRRLKEQVIDAMWKLEVPKGTTVVSQGDMGDPHMYVIETGKVLLYSDKGSLTVKERGPGMLFGELQMLYEAERTETVTAVGEPNVFWAIDRATFRNISAEDAELMALNLEQLLQIAAVLVHLLPTELDEFNKMMQPEKFEAGTIIVQEGQRTDSVYVLYKGEIDSLFSGTHQILYRGAFFCLVPTSFESVDISIPLPQIMCKTDVLCFRLEDVELARKILYECLVKRGIETPIKEIKSRLSSSSSSSPSLTTSSSSSSLVRSVSQHSIIEEEESDFDDDDEEEEVLQELSSLSLVSPKQVTCHTTPTTTTSSPSLENKQGLLPVLTWPVGKGPLAIPRESLKRIAFLGKGSYGHVELVRHIPTNRTFALKAVMKKEVIDCNQLGHIVNEKRVMMCFDSPFLVQLHSTYKDTDCVYFLLETALGGELFNVLRAHSILDDQKARFYAASVVLGLDHMHERGVVYRDLKPENILLDRLGFAKIADFGFAKQLLQSDGFRTFTLCGTPDYLAPEVLLGSGHSFGFDWWCMGVFIYELLAGIPPFSNSNHDVVKTYEDILAGNMKYPSYLSKEAKMIISDFMQYNAMDRLGVMKGGTKLVYQHPWFNGFDWEGLRNRTIEPPVKLKISNDSDVSNFDHPEDPNEEFLKPMRYVSCDDDWIWEREF